MESIEIKNFGPIKHVKLDLKDINVFIGPTASGKSTVAKLVAIVRDFSFVTAITFDLFLEYIIRYNIEFEVTSKTYIKYSNGRYYWELKHRNIVDNGSNWLLSTLVTMMEQLELITKQRKYPSGKSGQNVQKQLQTVIIAGFLLSDELDEIIKMEYKGDDQKLPKPVQDLLSIAKNYRKRLNTDDLKSEDNLAVVNELLNDSRLTELLPVAGTKMGPEQVLYVPAERSLISMVGESIFGLMSNNVSISTTIKEFGSRFEAARKSLKRLQIDFLNVEYEYSDRGNIVRLANNTETKLEQASSGLQSIIPLLLVVDKETDKKDTFEKYFIIEEPELNLYPITQAGLVNFIIERINKHQDKLIITTHSPYIITSLDNLIQADNAVKRNPEAEAKVEEIVPKSHWVDFDRVSCYYFKDGKCLSTLDKEYRSIGPSSIDDASINIGKTYDELLEIEYANVS